MQRRMWVMALVAVLGVGSATTGWAQQSAPPAGQTAAPGVVDLNSATAVQLAACRRCVSWWNAWP